MISEPEEIEKIGGVVAMKKIIYMMLSLAIVLGVTSASAIDYTAVVVSYAGDVQIFSGKTNEKIDCFVGIELVDETKIVTGEESYIEVVFDKRKNRMIKVTANSEVVIKFTGSDRVELVDGEVFAMLKNMEKGEVFRVKTPTAVCGARGTGWRTKTNGKETDVSVFDNKVFVRGFKKDGKPMEKEKWVKKGYERKIKKFEKPGKEKKIPEKRMNGYKKQMAAFKAASSGKKKKKDKKSGIADKRRQHKMERVQNRKDTKKFEDLKSNEDSDSGDSERGGGELKD